jgi:hypothetical protein
VDVEELVQLLDHKALWTEGWIEELQAELVSARQQLIDIRMETKAVRSAVDRVSGASKVEAPKESWVTLSGVDAVERALQESGPLFLDEIRALLVEHGRERPTQEAVSANLSYLSKHRSSVVNVGRGRWDYLRPALAVVEDARPEADAG